MMQKKNIIIVICLVFLTLSCSPPVITIFGDGRDSLKECVLEGEGHEKILMISISGFITDKAKHDIFRTTPGLVEDVVSQLKLAEINKQIKAVLFKIDSPGGSVTASDILYREIMSFKEKTGCKIGVIMMDVAASGGYYVALPADFIMAHPTTITGSIGVIFIHPVITGLMDKIGASMEVSKSGKNKDMGSPFRATTEEERNIMLDMTTAMNQMFMKRVIKHRHLDETTIEKISDARIYIAGDAVKLGLIDSVGYINDAITMTKKEASLPKNAKVVAYRRNKYPNDNPYNTAMKHTNTAIPFLNTGLDNISSIAVGFYYLWLPAFDKN